MLKAQVKNTYLLKLQGSLPDLLGPPPPSYLAKPANAASLYRPSALTDACRCRVLPVVLVWCLLTSVWASTEGYIPLIHLQVQGKASALLRTCSAAQVKHTRTGVSWQLWSLCDKAGVSWKWVRGNWWENLNRWHVAEVYLPQFCLCGVLS